MKQDTCSPFSTLMNHPPYIFAISNMVDIPFMPEFVINLLEGSCREFVDVETSFINFLSPRPTKHTGDTLHLGDGDTTKKLDISRSCAFDNRRDYNKLHSPFSKYKTTIDTGMSNEIWRDFGSRYCSLFFFLFFHFFFFILLPFFSIWISVVVVFLGVTYRDIVSVFAPSPLPAD